MKKKPFDIGSVKAAIADAWVFAARPCHWAWSRQGPILDGERPSPEAVVESVYIVRGSDWRKIVRELKRKARRG